MSLLDEARRLTKAVHGPYRAPASTPYYTIEDADTVALVATLPRIVAALEAAERLVGTEYVVAGDLVPGTTVSAKRVNALVAALRGEVAQTETLTQ